MKFSPARLRALTEIGKQGADGCDAGATDEDQRAAGRSVPVEASCEEENGLTRLHDDGADRFISLLPDLPEADTYARVSEMHARCQRRC